MKRQAIVLNRISSKDQASGHSLDAQLENAKTKAAELDVEIAKVWSGVLTSKKGKNFGRKDLEEMLSHCRQNKQVKYVLVDMVNRLMREMKVLFYYVVMFEQNGVKVIFCDPSQQHLNGDDQMAQLMLAIEAFKAEADNKTRGDTSISRMHSRIKQGYYLSHPHQGYMKSDIPGVHKPDPQRFKPLKATCRHIIYDGWSVNQAVKWLNDKGYRTRAGRKMTIDHFIDLFMDRYYCGYIDIKSEGWPKDIRGLHEPMLSVREHKILVTVMSKRNPRLRLQHNPEFPLANILRHEECVGMGGYEKFAGVNFNPGKRRNGSQKPRRPVYDCRDCRKRVNRDIVHANFTGVLASLNLVPNKKQFRQALIKVWKLQQGSVTERLRMLETRKQSIEQKLQDTTAAYASESDELIKDNLKKLIASYGEELKSAEADIISTRDIEMESEDFVNFAMQYVANLPENWWSLSYEDQKRGEQILFNGKIYANNAAIVRTPELSSIYRLGLNKKDLGEVSLVKMVELVGTAPTSASLSWLGFYRRSSFKILGKMALNEQKPLCGNPWA